MDQINHPDEKTSTMKTDENLVEVLLTPEEQAHIAKLRAEKVAPVSGLNILEATTQSAELTEQAPEKRGLTNKQKKWGASVLAVLLAVGIFAGTKFAKEKVEQTDNPTTTISEQAIPDEAKSFISEYGDRYSDPLSTYYAEKSYEANVSKLGNIMTDDYINSLELLNYPDGEFGEIGGFSRYILSLDAKYDKETFVQIFNEYTVKELNLYMNYLSKNNSQKAVDAIDNEFRNYCSDATGKGQPIEFTLDNAEIDTLMNTAKAVVAKYGSAANYKVAQGIIESSDPNETSFPGVLTSVESFDFYDQKIISLQYSGVDLVIGIDVFDGQNLTHTTETIKNLQLSITRQPITGTISDATATYISIGQRKEY